MTSTSISERCAIRTGADRENLLLSDTSTILRACSTMARDISTSRMSKSRRVPLEFIAEVPITAKSTRNCSIWPTVTAPTMPPSVCRMVPPVMKISIALLRYSSLATCRLLVMTRRPECLERAFANLLRRRSNIDKERGIVRDEPRRRLADQSLLLMCDELPGLISEILDARGDDRSAVNTNHLAGLAELVEIALSFAVATLN